MTFKKYIIILFALTFIVHGVLIWTGVTQLGPESGGLKPFDLRAGGYTPADAQAYLDVLTERGKAIIHGRLAVIDTVFPVLMGLFFASLIWRVGPTWLAPVPLLYTAMDLWENHAVAKMIDANDASLAITASAITQWKFRVLLASVILLIVLYIFAVKKTKTHNVS